MVTENKVCQNCKKNFKIDPEDFLYYEKIKVPPPTWCPWCRMVRRMAFWNERRFFKKKDINGKEILSTYPEESYFKIVDRDFWWSDQFEALDYGKDYDFSRSFFEQLKELAGEVPFPSRSVINAVDSDYADSSAGIKNCYMCFNAVDCEDCSYVVLGLKDKDCMDLYSVAFSQSCYEFSSGGGAYRLFFSSWLVESKESYFLHDSDNCTNCFGCVNLRHKQYYIWNESHTKEEYFDKLSKIDLGSYKSIKAIKDRFNKFVLGFPIQSATSAGSTGRISGESVINCNNALDCFKVERAENIRYCQNAFIGVKDSYDLTNSENTAELVYESADCRDSVYDLKFCFGCSSASRNLEYCISCVGSEDCFGCVGLRKKQYCIFNKQYSKEEYKKLRGEIIEQMKKMPYVDKKGRAYTYGEFFPIDMAPFAVNESAIADWTDETKERLESYGLIWRESNPREYKTSLNAADLPDHIKDAQDQVLKEIIGCLNCKRAYRVIPRELEFLRRFNLPLPRFCPDCRLKERLKHRTIPRLYSRNCLCSGETSQNNVYKNKTQHSHGSKPCLSKLETPYNPEDPRIIYCKECYEKELG